MPAKVVEKPKKPRPDFPLFPHASRRWAKKIRGRHHYFGSWDDGPEAALQRYLDVKDYLHAGRVPTDGSDFRLADLCNRFLTVKQRQADSRELSQRMFLDYHSLLKQLVANFGRMKLVREIGPAEFEEFRGKLALRHGPKTLAKDIALIRALFNWAYRSELIEKQPRFGPDFVPPSRRLMRLHREAYGSKMFEKEDIHLLLNAADPTLRTVILLGINCGFGPGDCSLLRESNLDGGWVELIRSKTGIKRRCPLWPETLAALREAIAKRPEPKGRGSKGFVFLTQQGRPWATSGTHAPLSRKFRQLLTNAGLYYRQRGLYALRHSFLTVAEISRDFPACRLIRGHSDASIASHYRERIDDDRLQAVVAVVHDWLYD